MAFQTVPVDSGASPDEPGRDHAWAWMGALLGIGAAYFGGAVLARGYLYFCDITIQDVPFRVFLKQSLWSAHLPVWNPYIFAGFPQFAEGQTAALYPPNLIAALFLPAHVGITWMVVAHRLLAGACMFLFARAWKLPPSSAFVAGLVFMYSGFLFANSCHRGLCLSAPYLPLVLYFLEIGLRRRRLIYALPVGVAWGVQFLIGFPPIAYLSVIAALAYLVLRAASLGMRATIGLAGGLFAGGLALGVGLAAVQILPTLSLVGHCARMAHRLIDGLSFPSLGPRAFVLFVAPNTWGNPAFGNYAGSACYWQQIGYVGLLPLGLALLGSVWCFRRYWIFVAMGLVSLALATGQVFDPAAHLARLGLRAEVFRVPTRYLAITTLCIAILAGCALDRLLRQARRKGEAKAWLAACFSLLAGYGLVTFVVLPGPARYSLSPAHSRLAPLSVLLLAGAAGMIVVAGSRRGLSRGSLTAFATALVLVDLLPWGTTQMPTVKAAYFTSPPQSARLIRQDKGWYRVVTWQPYPWPAWSSQWHELESALGMREGLLPNIPASYGIRTLQGRAGLFPRRWRAYMSHMPRLVLTPGEIDTRILDAAGVKYVVAAGPLQGGPLEMVSRDPWIYRNPSALPPCWVVPRAVVLPGLGAASQFMASDAFSPAHTAVLEKPVPPLTSDPKAFRGGARAVTLQPAYMEFDAWATAPALLLVNAAAFDPGWRATLSGVPARLYPADGMFQALWLPPGIHRVTMRYEPSLYVTGRQISLASLLLVIGLVWLGLRRPAGVQAAGRK